MMNKLFQSNDILKGLNQAYSVFNDTISPTQETPKKEELIKNTASVLGLTSDFLNKFSKTESTPASPPIKNYENNLSVEDIEKYKSTIDNNIAIEEILPYINSCDITSSSSMISFATKSQEELGKITDKLLSLSLTDEDHKIYKYMDILLTTITNFRKEDFEIYFKRKGSSPFFSSVVPLKRKVFLAKQDIASISSYLESNIPLIFRKRIQYLEELEKQYIHHIYEIKKSIEACKVLILYAHDHNSKDNILKNRLESLLQTMDNDKISRLQMEQMKNLFIGRIELINNTLLGLVSSWKGSLATLSNLIEVNDYNEVAKISGCFLTQSEQITSVWKRK